MLSCDMKLPEKDRGWKESLRMSCREIGAPKSRELTTKCTINPTAAAIKQTSRIINRQQQSRGSFRRDFLPSFLLEINGACSSITKLCSIRGKVEAEDMIYLQLFTKWIIITTIEFA